jgi:D-sedoheptulose 7-phosphate isomerase
MKLSINSKNPAIENYVFRLGETLRQFNWSIVHELAEEMMAVWKKKSSIWVCGNGGSAANAIHWANDFLYPVAKKSLYGIKINSLSANPAVVTCLGNDIGYENIFSYQLRTLASQGDLLIALSGSGNSPNIVEGMRTAREMGVKTCAIIGFDGGAALTLADLPIHFDIDDMQVAEDAQMVVCHALVQALVNEPGRPS